MEILNSENLRNWYSSGIISVIKSRTVRWARHVACMGDGRLCTFLVSNPEKIARGKVLLKCIFHLQVVRLN
jgi:hypothetical protein